VQRFGHFARAAEYCRVTHPTLSMQIQKLEEDLGVVLFDRAKKPILLTEVGRRVLEQMQAVLFEAKKLEGIVSADTAQALRGELVLGVIPTIAPYLLPRLLPVLERDYPNLDLNIREMQTSRIIDALGADEIDVGLLATPLKAARIFEKPLFYEPFSVLCHSSHELGRQKRIKYPSLKFGDIWLLEEGHCLRHQVLDVCSIRRSGGAKRRYEFESGSLETLKNLVASYGGYTLLPYLATEHLDDRTKLVDFEKPLPAREIGLAYRREHYKAPLIEALGAGILAALPEELRKARARDFDVLGIA